MTALALLVFMAAGALAMASMASTIGNYGAMALALGAAAPSDQKSRGRRSVASRTGVGTPRRAMARGRRALHEVRRDLQQARLAGAFGQGRVAMVRS